MDIINKLKKILYSLATDKKDGLIYLPIKIILLFLSFIYYWIVKWISYCYDAGIFSQTRLPRKVISIGNITVGGVGKTPIVELIAKLIKENNNKRPVILTRGYMTSSVAGINIIKKGIKEGVNHKQRRYKIVSDEACMLKKKLSHDIPILVGPDRINNASNFLKKHKADIFILDDGFQHRKLFRDMDIVAIDTTNPWGNGFLIPRGILREPISALKRADIFMLTKTDLGIHNLEYIKKEIHKIANGVPVVETIHRPICLKYLSSHQERPLKYIKGKKIAALAGIGDSLSFKKTLEGIGCIIEKNFFFIDHYIYNIKDIDYLHEQCCLENINIIVTTAKDAVKLQRFISNFKNIAVFYLEIEIYITKGKDILVERINHLLQC